MGSERSTDAVDDSFVPKEEAEHLLDKHMTRWGSLLDRLK